jgi:CHAT domain-containing protein
VSGKLSAQSDWGKPRYLALVLDHRGSTRAVDLGDAVWLEQAIASALDRTRFQQPGAVDAWALVAEKLFSPLRAALEGKRQLLVSPDGQLHRVPFSALSLLAGNSADLPTSLSLQTIGSGRDLVPVTSPTLASSPPPATAPLVLADPQTTGWDPLVRAASEGQSVASALGTQPHLGKTATVALLEQTRGPRLVHVAGHGFFDPKASGDPLLASGLALAGADKARLPSKPPSPAVTAPSPAPDASPTDDGYLTAKEAARLQLDGSTLVVLSACESGLGSDRSGEGLFGLRRALTVAGARGTLLSLWKVPEHATETFMTRFYALLGQGVSPAEAVRRVQTEFRDRPAIDGWSDPFYWAGWQYSGLPDSAR